jgi:hypothetical protein
VNCRWYCYIAVSFSILIERKEYHYNSYLHVVVEATPTMRALIWSSFLLYLLCTSTLPTAAAADIDADLRHLASTETQKESDSQDGKHAEKSLWSVVFPVLSMSFLSWIIKNGSRCCSYDEDVVLDDIVNCRFAREEAVPDDPETVYPETEDIELQSVPPENSLSKQFASNDPVITDKVSLLNCSCTDSSEDVSDTSFSWIQGASNSRYMNMND